MKKNQKNVFASVVMIIILSQIFYGCASAQSKDSTPWYQSVLPSKSSPPPNPMYLDFNDILIPSELERDNDMSFVLKASGYSAGVLSLKGRVEVSSLISFFIFKKSLQIFHFEIILERRRIIESLIYMSGSYFFYQWFYNRLFQEEIYKQNSRVILKNAFKFWLIMRFGLFKETPYFSWKIE